MTARRRLSIRRRLGAIAVLGGLLFFGSALGFRSLRGAVRTHLDDVALDEVRHDLARVAAGDDGGELSSRPCRAGTLRGGVVDGDGVAALGSAGVPDAPLAVLRELLEAGAPRLVPVADGAGSWIVGVEPMGPGRAGEARIAWSVLDVDDPPEVERSRLIGLGLAVLVLVLVAASLQLAWALHGAIAGLSRSIDRLTVSLEVPVERAGISELAPVEEGIQRLAAEVSRGIAERERLGQELADKERLATLGRVTAGLAHELRNPLAAMKLRVDLARGGDTSRLSEDLATVSTEIERLDRLVSDLLVYAGRRHAARAPFDLGMLARRRADVLYPGRDARGRIHVHGSSSASIDVDAMGRVLDNLLRNAFEASPPGANVEVLVRAEGRRIDVEVIDEGPGVSLEAAPQLFEPFFTTKPDGVGLGLALSRTIARAHGGDLSYVRRGERTVFTLTLPRDGDTTA